MVTHVNTKAKLGPNSKPVGCTICRLAGAFATSTNVNHIASIESALSSDEVSGESDQTCAGSHSQSHC